MRLWSVHPRYLDSQGLVALWREALLAKKVLEGGTRGYRHHPQLRRFRAHPDPPAAIASYLRGIAAESDRRGFRFDTSKIGPREAVLPLEVTSGQVRFEWAHLMKKLCARSPEVGLAHASIDTPLAHPFLRVVPGPVEEWERGSV